MPVTSDEFRRIALSMPEAIEGEHMGHPDFRVKGKIFATLFSRDEVESGMVKLRPPQQRELVQNHPKTFQPLKGGWGRQGCTQVCLKSAGTKAGRNAMFRAWCNTAPKTLVEKFEFES